MFQQRSKSKDIERAPLIRRLFEEYATGEYTLAELRRRSIDWGLSNSKGKEKPLSKSQISELIANPFYCAVIHYKVKNEFCPHVYKPIISKALFDQCQAVKLSNKKIHKHKWGTKDHLFSKLIRCAVTGRRVSCDTKTKTYVNGKKDQWSYLVTRNPSDVTKKLQVREAVVIEQIEAVLKSLHISDEELSKLEQEFLVKEDAQVKYFNKERNNLDNLLIEVNTKLEKLSDFLIDGTIDDNYYKEKRAKLILEQQSIGHQIDKINADKDEFSNTILNTIREASAAYTDFKAESNAQKREIIEKIFERLELKGEQLQYVILYPYDGCVKNNVN